MQQPDRVFQSLAFAVRAFAASGAVERARELASEFDLLTLGGRRPPPAWSYIHFAWAATEVGSSDELDRLLAGQKRQTTWVVATRAVLAGDYAAAAELFGRMRTRPHEAYARLRAAEKRVATGRRPEGDEQLTNALAFFRSVRATRYIREAETLLSAFVDARTSVGE